MATIPCERTCDESFGFPSALRSRARAAVALFAQDEVGSTHGAFDVNVDGETLRIPVRLYYDPARLRRALADAHGVDRHILACLGTRHYDGYVRQACLARIVGADDTWLIPYILQLAGEYVIEIVDDVARWVERRDSTPLADFARDNPAYMSTLERRVTSYWNCYHRRDYPDRADYPGTRVLARTRPDATVR